MKNEEPQLFKYKIVYTPKYMRSSGIKPDGCFEDITEFFDEIIRHYQGQHSKYHAKSPIMIVLSFDKHQYTSLVIRFRGVLAEDLHAGVQRDVEFLSCYYDDEALNANPYRVTVNEKFSMREDLQRAMDLIKLCVGQYYYTGKTLEKHNYFFIENKNPKEDKPRIDDLFNLMKSRRNVAITKHDLLNNYLKTLEPGIAYTRKEQERMCSMICHRFGIGIDDRKKIVGKPFHYLNKALKYTDFKVVPVDEEKQFRTVSTYYGMRMIVPKDQSEKVDFFAETQNKLRKAMRKK